ncbi:uncharacterized protein AAEQ78_018943 [Lycaon pictus]
MPGESGSPRRGSGAGRARARASRGPRAPPCAPPPPPSGAGVPVRVRAGRGGGSGGGGCARARRGPETPRLQQRGWGLGGLLVVAGAALHPRRDGLPRCTLGGARSNGPKLLRGGCSRDRQDDALEIPTAACLPSKRISLEQPPGKERERGEEKQREKRILSSPRMSAEPEAGLDLTALRSPP